MTRLIHRRDMTSSNVRRVERVCVGERLRLRIVVVRVCVCVCVCVRVCVHGGASSCVGVRRERERAR